MAVLTNAERKQVSTGAMRWWSGLQESVPGCTKSDIQAAVDAADSWIDTNAPAYNLALPLTFRTNASPTQKALLLVFVIARRFSLAILKKIAGEVD